MRISVVFSRICLLWMLFGQAACVVCLYGDSDWDSLSNAPVFTRICSDLPALALMGILVLLTIGILLALVNGVKERRLGLNTVWALPGIAYITLAFVGVVLIESSASDLNGLPPGLDQFVWIGIVLLLDIAAVIAVRRMLRGYQA